MFKFDVALLPLRPQWTGTIRDGEPHTEAQDGHLECSRSMLLYVHRDQRIIRDGEPRTSTSNFTQPKFDVAALRPQRPQWTRTVRDTSNVTQLLSSAHCAWQSQRGWKRVGGRGRGLWGKRWTYGDGGLGGGGEWLRSWNLMPKDAMSFAKVCIDPAILIIL